MAAEEKDEGANESAKKKGGKKTLIIILLLVLLIAGGGAGAFFALKGKDSKTEAGGEDQPEGEEESAEGELPPAMLPLDAFIVNLKDKNSYLKVTIQVELFEPEVPKTMENETGKIKDAVIGLLSSKSVEELLAPEGKAKLKQELVIAINEALGGETVAAAYFTEFIIQ